MAEVKPPAGLGNPLGMAGLGLPRMGPCSAGRTVRKDQWPWRDPCMNAANAILVARENDAGPDDEPVLLPLCQWHRELMDAGGHTAGEPPEEPS